MTDRVIRSPSIVIDKGNGLIVEFRFDDQGQLLINELIKGKPSMRWVFSAEVVPELAGFLARSQVAE